MVEDFLVCLLEILPAKTHFSSLGILSQKKTNKLNKTSLLSKLIHFKNTIMARELSRTLIFFLSLVKN